MTNRRLLPCSPTTTEPGTARTVIDSVQAVADALGCDDTVSELDGALPLPDIVCGRQPTRCQAPRGRIGDQLGVMRTMRSPLPLEVPT